jgi:hypothetical protein
MEHAPLIVLVQLRGNSPTHLYPLQESLLPYLHIINTGWFIIWCVTATVLIVRTVKELYERYR